MLGLMGTMGLLGMGISAFAQPSSRSPLAPPPNGPRKSEPGDGYIALTNATIHVKPGERIEKGTVVFRNGKIESVAAGEANVPAGAEPREHSPSPPMRVAIPDASQGSWACP